MDIHQAPPTGSLNPDSKSKNLRQDSKDRKRKSDKGDYSDPWRDPAAFKVDGLLLNGLSNEVQNVIETLRKELEQAKGREVYYRTLLEKHTFLDILCRKSFIQKLGNIITRSKNFSIHPHLLILHIKNGDKIRITLGRSALDNFLKHAVKILKKSIEKTDVLGSLGGNDFGLILLNEGLDDTGESATKVLKDLNSEPFSIGDQKINMDVALGFKLISPTDTVETALKIADRSLRNLSV